MDGGKKKLREEIRKGRRESEIEEEKKRKWRETEKWKEGWNGG